VSDYSARIFAAALVSPLSILIVVPVGVAAGGMWQGILPPIPAAIGFAGMLLIFAYPTMLIVGLPSYLVLHHWKLDSVWSAAGVGLLAAVLVPLLLQLESGIETARTGIKPEIAYSNLEFVLSHPTLLLGPLDLLGPVVGVVFWWIAKPRPKLNKKPN